jgi:hypothetical protein
MASVSLSLLIVKSTSTPKGRVRKELIMISAVNLKLLRLVFGSTGLVAGQYGRGWLYVDSCAGTVLRAVDGKREVAYGLGLASAFLESLANLPSLRHS